jgi:hypothetical protein
MSSHREAPSISKDPVADNTDVYAFRTPGDTVTFIACYLPSQSPAGGPNFYEFGDDVLYEINIDNDSDAKENVLFQFRFKTVNTNPNTFLYNTGPIATLDDPNWNRRQTYTVTHVGCTGGKRGRRRSTVLGRGLATPPVNVGPRSTPNYEALASAAVHTVTHPHTGHTIKVFAGQRADAFFVDLGSIFDLAALRPFQGAHLIKLPGVSDTGVDALAQANVQAIAIQVPIAMLTKDGSVPTDVMDSKSTIGVYASASRQRGTTIRWGRRSSMGPWEQVSRLGNPLFNEVLVPLARKDEWNATDPCWDSNFAQYVARPELAGLLPVLYPGAFPNLAALDADRADLLAILLTGIPAGVVPGFQNFTGSTQADLLRLNMAVPPAAGPPNRLGLVGGDPAGFPNGRRLEDDVTTIELRAVAGLTYPLVAPSYVPDGAAAAIEDGTFNNPGRVLLSEFPYIGTPYSGYSVGT